MAKYDGFHATTFKADLRRLVAKERADLARGVGRASRVLAREIRRRAPVDEGVLKASVVAGPVVERGRVISQVVEVEGGYPDGRWYVGFVEYGSRDTPPNPFIRRSIAAKEAEMARIIESSIDQD